MAKSDDLRAQVDQAADQIGYLRERVEKLMRERVTPALADASDEAESAIYSARDAVLDGAEMVTGQVREQPMLALLLATGLGFVLGRILR